GGGGLRPVTAERRYLGAAVRRRIRAGRFAAAPGSGTPVRPDLAAVDSLAAGTPRSATAGAVARRRGVRIDDGLLRVHAGSDDHRASQRPESVSPVGRTGFARSLLLGRRTGVPHVGGRACGGGGGK